MLEMLQKWDKGRHRETYLKPPGVPEPPLCIWSLADTGGLGGVGEWPLSSTPRRAAPSFWELI